MNNEKISDLEEFEYEVHVFTCMLETLEDPTRSFLVEQFLKIIHAHKKICERVAKHAETTLALMTAKVNRDEDLIRKSIDAMDELRFILQEKMHDLEATRRERDDLRRRFL